MKIQKYFLPALYVVGGLLLVTNIFWAARQYSTVSPSTLSATGMNQQVQNGDDGKKLAIEKAQNSMAQIVIPYNYYDSAYDKAKNDCNAPDCVNVRPGYKQGDYDENNEETVIITGELMSSSQGPYSRRQITLICNVQNGATTCIKMVNGLDIPLMEYMSNFGKVTMNDYSSSNLREEKLRDVVRDKNTITMREHFIQDAGGVEYRVDRRKREVTISYFRDSGKSEIDEGIIPTKEWISTTTKSSLYSR